MNKSKGQGKVAINTLRVVRVVAQNVESEKFPDADLMSETYVVGEDQLVTSRMEVLRSKVLQQMITLDTN